MPRRAAHGWEADAYCVRWRRNATITGMAALLERARLAGLPPAVPLPSLAATPPFQLPTAPAAERSCLVPGQKGQAMRDVFISYATEDKVTADAACGALEATGLRCWIAPRDIHPGSVWGEAIVDGISHSASFVLVFSDAANRSRHIPRELECAVDQNLPIIPFRVEPVMPSKSLSYFIGASQWLEGQPPPVEQHLDDLVAAVRYQLGPLPSGALRTQVVPIPASSSGHETSASSTRRPGQLSGAEAARRRRRRLLAIGLAACILVVGAGRVFHWSALGFGPGAPGRAASPATCGSAYGAGRWSGALAQCVEVAAAGNLAAQRLVGVVYRRGLGVARNPGRAATWFQRAAAHGDEEARAKLREMYGDRTDSISPTQPYSANEVTELVTSGARPPVILKLIDESCLRFSLDSTTADRLLAANATGELVAGIRSACRAPTAAGAPPISVAELDALVRQRARTLADSAGATDLPSTIGLPVFVGLGKAWWRALVDWAASAAAAPPASSPPAPVPRPHPRRAATPPTARTAAPPPAAGTAAPTPATGTAAPPPAGGPVLEQKGTGSVLDAAKKGAQEAAAEEARRKAGEAVKKALNFH
jgi:hypothetical protein